MFHKITFYFVGGTNVTYDKCDDKTASSVRTWLDNDNIKLFRIDTGKENKVTLIRKDLVLFVNIVS